MATASYVVEIEWGGATGTFSHASANVTTRVFSVECNRGRDVASQLTGRSQPGSCQILLNNQSGDYNSYNSTGPLFGSLLPGRLVQIRATAPTAGTLWRGYISRIVPGPSVKGVDTAIIEAEGPLGYINQKDINPPILTAMETGSVVATLLDKAGWFGSGTLGGSFRDIDAGRTVIETFAHKRDKPMVILRKIEETESGFLRESNNGKIVFEDRYRRLTTPYSTSVATFSDAAGATLAYNAITQEDPIAFIFNDLVTTIETFATGAEGTLWHLAKTGADAYLPASSTRVYIASYPGPTAAVNDIGVFSWVTPTATVDYNIDSDPAGIGTNMNGEVALTVVDNVNELEITFNNTSTRDGYVQNLVARGVPLQRDDPLIIPKRDSTSEIKFGKRTAPAHAGYIPSVQEAVDWGDWNSAIYKDPVPRFVISYTANRSTAHLNQAILRDISDLITIIATGTSNRLGVNATFTIEKVEHKIESDRTHTVSYYVAEGEAASTAWVLDTSQLGTSTIPAY